MATETAIAPPVGNLGPALTKFLSPESLALREKAAAEHDAYTKASDERKKRDRRAELVRASGIHQRARQLAEAGFTSNHTLWNRNLEVLKGKLGKGVVLALLGKRGTGKTIAASLLVYEHCQQEKRARYVSALEFFQDLQETYRPASRQSEKEVIATYKTPALLVIDEAHERSQSAWTDRMLTFLVDQRYADMKDTILIANQTPEEFGSLMGPSVIDRASEGGGILIYDWASFRGKP